MKIHLIRSEEISLTRFKTILEIIQKFQGPIQFKALKEDLAEDSEKGSDFENQEETTNEVSIAGESIKPIKRLRSLSWDEIFAQCESFRSIHKIKMDEVVLLLTDHPNHPNYFSTWDPTGKLNYFVQTSLWELFIDADSCYPIVYELASAALYMASCDDPDEMERVSHDELRGCAFDYCRKKEQIQFKLRTADICHECLQRIIGKNIDQGIIDQVFKIYEGVRNQMLFRERFVVSKKLSRMELDILKHELRFVDFWNI